MKNIIWIIVLSIIFLTIFRFLRKLLMIKKVFKEALNQQQNTYNQDRNTTNSKQKSNNQNSFDKPKYNIDAETVDYEIIEDKKDEK